MNTRLVVLAAALLALGAFSATAAPAAGFDPYDFDVKIEMGGDFGGGTPSCRDDGAGGQVCTVAVDVSETGTAAKGTVRQKSRDLSGSIETVCDMAMRMRQVMRMSRSGGMKIEEFSGTGSQRCTWHMDFGAGSTLTGTIAGEMSQGLVNAETGYFRGRFDVVVTAGTGAFDGYVGTGSFDNRDEFPLLRDAPNSPPSGSEPPSGAAPPPPSTAPAGATRSLAFVLVAAKEGGAMKLKLRKGRPIAKIIAPGPKLARGSKATLRVAAAPGSTCTAFARSGAAKVALGRAVDTDRDGAVAFTGKLASLLKPGSWKLSASCTYALGARKGTAADSVSVLVA